MIVLMHLKHGQIRVGCIKKLNLLALLGWVGLGPNFPTFNGLGWVGLGWVGSGHTRWTHGQLCGTYRNRTS